MEKEGPTDVLAFPMDELRPGLVNEEPEEGVLGDLVLCPAVAERQAVEAGHSTEDEIELLTVHGILHLLGYDHAEPEEHKEMFGLQAQLLDEWRRPVNPRPRDRDDEPVLAGRLGRRPGRPRRRCSPRPTPRSSSFSSARAEELAAEGKAGSAPLLVILDDPPRYLNTALFLRMLSEIAAIVLVTPVRRPGAPTAGGPTGR